MIVGLDLPPRALHAHTKGHWRNQQQAKAAYRREAYLRALPEAPPEPLEEAKLAIRFYWPNRRRRDTLSAVQSLKPAIDGLVDAGWIVDDDWQHLGIGTIEAAVDSRRRRHRGPRHTLPLELTRGQFRVILRGVDARSMMKGENNGGR